MKETILKITNYGKYKIFTFPDYFFYYEYCQSINQRTRHFVINSKEPSFRVLSKGEIEDGVIIMESWFLKDESTGKYKNYSTGEFSENVYIDSLKSAIGLFKFFVIEIHLL